MMRAVVLRTEREKQCNAASDRTEQGRARLGVGEEGKEQYRTRKRRPSHG
jgi:hypothetical protein